ncbi:MAG: hypothetical protein H6617_02860 [Bdellovibrionaceae bacterium]|nr:hypothetical protein [Bdellovibrionales bacterium]MCB9253602.1 hypothetical protein [Pseudobdellovibrionaceae bacterium]
MSKVVVYIAFVLCSPALALRLTCVHDFAEQNAFPLHVDVDDLEETSLEWELALHRLQGAGTLKTHRAWMLPTTLIPEFNAEQFSVAWEYSKRFAPAHAYYQVLIAIAYILKEAHNEETASAFLASVLTRPPELQPELDADPSVDDLCTSGLGSAWNYMVVFYLLYDTGGDVPPHESAFNKLQNNWLLALKSQLASATDQYPLSVLQEFLPSWYATIRGQHFRAVQTAKGVFQASLETGGFFRRKKDLEIALGQKISIEIKAGAATMGPSDTTLLLRTDHLDVTNYLKPEQLAYTVLVEGTEVGMGLRISRETRDAIGDLIGGYLAVSRTLPQQLPDRRRRP